MSLPVLAGEGSVNVGASLTNAVGVVLDMAGTVLDKIVEHPVLSVFFALSLVGLIVGVISSLKHA